MTKAATVVRHNDDACARPTPRSASWQQRAERCSLSDTGNWTNQNVVFTKALETCSRWPRRSCKGRLQRDECRGAHFKPEFAMPGIDATDPAEHRRAGGSLVRPVRGEQPQVAEDRRSPRCGPTASRS